MTIRTLVARWAPPAVVLLTTAWVLGMILMLLAFFGIGMEQWANSYDDDPARAAELRHKAALVLLSLAAVAVGGAGLTAVVAYVGHLKRTGSAYLLLAVILGVLAVTFVPDSYRTLNPPAPPPPAPTYCQELSGSDTRCPGG